MTFEDDLAAAWRSAPELSDSDLRARIDRIVSAPGVPSSIAAFERAGADDSTGRPDLAVSGYRRALELGLDDDRARQATIQLASSLRNLGDPAGGLTLLGELDAARGDGLDPAIAIFRALCLTDLDRSTDAVALLIDALADSLSRYQRSSRGYAAELRSRARH
ncbi:tetratricopeptide repeat protein [Tsukamurella ocularis]|uniref:tetratricopeptide repeat protein n=1 Tax=Tsukamurella ocularis TaxID=1970234 RepID=UPI0021698CDE|nr:tetratricopeptide repeat protein [Tsukamurella ocularis]MCS3778969.1 hypothetical protein [Tsukamurella ocularis]MCS3787411.1 hypothetical protein [Tsukamurella ocularis]MCS3851652.1 hypothetical protein [Tsukamurella ocularis]